MSLGKELLVDNSQNTCEAVVSSISQNDDADPLFEDYFLNQLQDYGIAEMLFNPSMSSNAKDIRLENVCKSTRKTKQRKGEGEEWKCDVCSKVFPQHSILVRHLRIHSKERNYMCEVCGKAFRQQSTLYQHRTLHTMAKPYSCPVCDKSFSRASTLVSHRRIHDGEKPHQCPHCPQAFHEKANLRHHIYTHTNERPYKCDICAKGFNQMSNLTRHKLKIHGIVQRYECHMCGKSFKIREHCQKHELYDHADRHEDPASQSTTDKSNMADGDCDDIPNLPANTIKIVVDPISTEAMRVARTLNQQPLLVQMQPLDGEPAIMRVYEDGEKQRLESVSWTDVCCYSQILDINESKNALEKFRIDLKLPVMATIHEITAPEGTVETVTETVIEMNVENETLDI